MSLLLFFLIFTGFYLLGRRIGGLFGAVWTLPGENLVFSISLGTVGLSLIITLLAFSHLLYPATGWILLGLMFLVSPRETQSTFQSLWNGCKGLDKFRESLSTFNVVLGLLLLVTAVSAWILASAPPVRTDALVYHLALPKTYLTHHGIVNLPNNLYSFFPQLFEMVYLFAMMFGQENLPALIGLGNAFVLLTALGCYFRNHLSLQYSLLIPLIFFSTPTFWEISASAYVDLALAGFIFLSFYSWDRWRETGKPFWFGFMILFAAAAWATKLTAFIVLALVGFAIVFEARRHQNLPRLFRQLILFVGVVFLLMFPWWARNFYFSDNPFTPLFMQALGGEERINWDPSRAALFNQYVSMFGMGRSISDFFLLPYNLTFHSESHSLNFDGKVGIVYFLLIPALWGIWRGRNTRIAAMTLVFSVLIVFWFLYFQYVRFLAPAFAFLTLLSVYGLHHLLPGDNEDAEKGVWNWIWKTILVLGLVFNLTLIVEICAKKQPLDVLLGRESRDDYLTRNITVYPMYRVMNQRVGPNDKVLFIYMRNLGYLAERPFFSDSIFEAHTLQKLLTEGIVDAEILNRLQQLEVTHIMFDSRYMWGQDAAFSPEQQTAFQRFLERHGELLGRKNVFYLYRFVLD